MQDLAPQPERRSVACRASIPGSGLHVDENYVAKDYGECGSMETDLHWESISGFKDPTPATKRGKSMLDQIAQDLIILPIIGFLLAAGAGVLIRSRRAREDKRVRDRLRLAGSRIR